MEDPLRLGPYQRCESNLVVDSDIALLFVLRCDAHFAKFLQASPAKPSPASPTAYQRRYIASPSPNRDDDKRSGVTFIVKAKTGGQGLVFAFVSLAHLYSFCMMLSIHSHDTTRAQQARGAWACWGRAARACLGMPGLWGSHIPSNDYNDPCVLYYT